MDEELTFGQWLRRSRKARDLTQTELAGQVSCALGTIRKLEADELRPSKELAMHLAAHFGVPEGQREAFVAYARGQADTPLPSPRENATGATASTALPRGTVTFLFTDIEGSTRLWEQHPQIMPDALARHDAILHQAIAAQAGVVYKVVGDAFQAAFATAPAACAAALAAQRALAREAWGLVGTVPVRMALHTCAAEPTEGDYRTGALNRLGRLLGAVHGGQILLSHSTADLTRETLPPDVTLRDLGERRLRDLSPEPVFQLLVPDLPSDFPPLKTLDRPRHNLPVPPTSFIGREREVAAVRQQLLRPDVRLLTLTGPGGTGKTRLALRVAADLLDDFRHGVWFVDLAPVRDPVLVVPTIATALGMRESGVQALADSLRTYLRDRQLLLVLDNFEQVVTAALAVAELLAAAPQITMLVTSRVVVGVYGEHDVGVSPLVPPDSVHLPSLDALQQNEAVQLFLARAQAAAADFALTTANARVVAEICQRLEGLPLAIELAATRLRHLPVEHLLSRLSSRLTLLTGGARTLPARQQTLRDTLAWSYDLLEPDEQRLFRRLAVFVGGWTLEAAEVVCGGWESGDGGWGAVPPPILHLPTPVLDGLATLVDNSLVRQSAGMQGEPWFTMLETVREYALEQLAASGEVEAVRRQHAAYYLALAERAEPELRGPQQATWMARLELEHNNMRAVLAWSQTAAASDRQAGELGARLAVAVWEFWSRRGSLSEGRRWLTGAQSHLAVDLTEPEARRLRARALSAAGNLAGYQGDAAAGRPLLEESLALFEDLGDAWGSAYVRLNLGWASYRQGNLGQAKRLMEQSLASFRTLGDRWGSGWALRFLTVVLIDAAGSIGAQDQSDRALVLMEESLAHFRAVGDIFGIGLSLNWFGSMAAKQGDGRRARVLLAESLALFDEIGYKVGVFGTLMEFAQLVAMHGQAHLDAEHATRVFGAAEALEDSLAGLEPIYLDRTEYERTIAMLRKRLGEATFAAAWAEGRAMTFEQAITQTLDYGLSVT